jgi:flagellar hook-associated protein 2
MSVNPLSTSGIEQLVNQYATVERNRTVSPLETRKSKLSSLSSAWGELSNKLESFKNILYDLKSTSTSSLFNSKKASLSSSDYFTATAATNATAGNYSIRVNQLAKSDLLVSSSLAFTADTYDINDMSGTHTIKIGSGDYTSYVDVEFDNTENYQTLMQKLSTAINTDKAVVKSSTANQSNTFTGTGEFKVNLNGTETTIAYDYSNISYSDVISDLISKLSDISGITAEEDTSTGQLKLTVNDSSKYISIKNSDDTGGLLSFLGIDVNKEKAASALSTASYFAPSTGYTKFSLTADNTGYDNRLILEDVTGNALGKLGISASILANRTLIANDNSAGFVYSANSATDNQLNAKLNFNGINIQRNSNNITDLVTGVTFNLTSVMPETAKTVDVTVASDDTTIKNKIKDFIKSFNDVYLNIKNKSTSDKLGRGIFTSDSTAQSVLRTLTNAVMSPVSTASDSSLNRLSAIGITFDPTSGLTFADETKFSQAISEKPNAVASIFNSSSGIATSLYSNVNSYLGSTGVIASVKNSYDNNIKYLTDKIASVQARIDKSSEVLRKKYNEMQNQYAALINSQNMLNSLASY